MQCGSVQVLSLDAARAARVTCSRFSANLSVLPPGTGSDEAPVLTLQVYVFTLTVGGLRSVSRSPTPVRLGGLDERAHLHAPVLDFLTVSAAPVSLVHAQ